MEGTISEPLPFAAALKAAAPLVLLHFALLSSAGVVLLTNGRHGPPPCKGYDRLYRAGLEPDLQYRRGVSVEVSVPLLPGLP